MVTHIKTHKDTQLINLFSILGKIQKKLKKKIFMFLYIIFQQNFSCLHTFETPPLLKFRDKRL